MMNGYWGVGMWLGSAMMILFWIGVIVVASWGFRMLFAERPSIPPTQTESALGIVQLRYSRGEISHDEYIALVNDLKQLKEIIK